MKASKGKARMTQDAIHASIKAWEAKLSYAKDNRPEDIKLGTSSCPLCGLFNRPEMTYPELCAGCPVVARTGERFCWGTPYYVVEKILEDRNHLISTLPDGEHKALVQAVEAEIEFLKSLLME